MKRRILQTIVALLAIVGGATAQTLSVASVEATTGGQAELVVSGNDMDMYGVTALQFNLALPQGVTLNESAIAKGNAASGHTLSVQTMANGDRLFSHPYFLQTAYSDKDYFHGHAQLRNSLTAAIRPSDAFQPFNQGIFIDIFVLDEAPDDEAERKDLARCCRKTQRFLKAKNTHIIASGRLGLVFRKMKCRREVRRRGWQTIYREMEDRLRGVDPGKCGCWAELAFSGDDIMFPKHIFDRTLWMPFENISVPVPAEYDLFLRTQFGDDYMTPRQDPSYHGQLIFDTEKSYLQILPQVQREYRASALKRLLKKL